MGNPSAITQSIPWILSNRNVISLSLEQLHTGKSWPKTQACFYTTIRRSAVLFLFYPEC